VVQRGDRKSHPPGNKLAIMNYMVRLRKNYDQKIVADTAKKKGTNAGFRERSTNEESRAHKEGLQEKNTYP